MLKEAKRQFKYDQKKLRNLETGQAIISFLLFLYFPHTIYFQTIALFSLLHTAHFTDCSLSPLYYSQKPHTTLYVTASLMPLSHVLKKVLLQLTVLQWLDFKVQTVHFL